MEMTTRPIKIGVDVHHTYLNKKGEKSNRVYSYELLKKNYPEDWDGWVDIISATPFPFDLVYLATEEGEVMPGWWRGHRWDAIRLKKEDNVTAWKYRGNDL